MTYGGNVKEVAGRHYTFQPGCAPLRHCPFNRVYERAVKDIKLLSYVLTDEMISHESMLYITEPDHMKMRGYA